MKMDDLDCGIHSNIDDPKMEQVMTEFMNRVSPYEITRRPDGTYLLREPDDAGPVPSVTELAKDPTVDVDGPEEHVPEDKKEQETSKSGIIIKDCMKKVSSDELAKIRSWIADFEKRSGVNG